MSKSLDTLIQTRQTVRAFTQDIVSPDTLEAIIEAGRQAPFAGLAQAGRESFRYFYVISPDASICPLINQLVADTRRLDYETALKHDYAKSYPQFMKVLEAIHDKPVDNLFISPHLILVAEHAGMPAREHVVLGHVMQNMWLKTADLDLAFRPCSNIADIQNTAPLIEALNLPPGEYAFDACNIGYPANPAKRSEARKLPLSQITYLD